MDDFIMNSENSLLLHWATEAIPVPTLIIDQNLVLRCWNPAIERATGIGHLDALGRCIDSDVFLSLPELVRFVQWVMLGHIEQLREHFSRKNLVQGRLHPQGWECELSLRILDEDRDVALYAAPIRDGEGSLLGAILTMRDVAERKHLLDQLLHAQKMETLGTLVAGVAHEINNPVNLLLYNLPLFEKLWKEFLPVLSSCADSNPDRRFAGLPVPFLVNNLPTLISDMNLAATRIAKIVSGLKSYSRFSDAGERAPFDLNQAVENALRLAHATLRGRKITLKAELNPELPSLIGNLHSIEQVILNLVINAAQAIDHAEGRIHIQTDVRSDGYMVLTVTDNGKGIDPAIAGRIFDPFVTTKQNSGGTGLGLSVSFNIVQSHGGIIRFKTQREMGTTFQVLFPVGEKRPIHRILVVDDDPLIRDLLADILLSQRSCKIEEASNGIEACIRIGSFRPDLLVLDLFMPEMNGLEVCRVIRNDPELANLKILVVTGHSAHGSLDEIRRMGKTDVLFKPFDIQEFLKKVDNILAE
jgi:signal transduction histidine kinase